MNKPRQLKLKVDPGPRVKESALQMQIVAVLSGLGYTCLVTGFYRKRARCPTCSASFWPSGGNGNAPGVADVLITRAAWPVGVWAALEIKGRGTVVSPEQKLLAEAGRNVIVRSIAEAVDAAAAAERALGLTHVRLERFWENNPRTRFE